MASADQIERVFLGTDGPALPMAADWLVERLGGAGGTLGGSLGEALVVVPGRRGERRLLELLAERSEGRALVPPRVVTLGGLVDRLVEPGGAQVVGDLESLLCWASVLREAGPGVLGDLVPHAPGRDDWPGWWSLAEQVVSAADELGAQGLGLRDVAGRSEHAGDEPRWAALAALAQHYEEALSVRGLVDRHAARWQAIGAGACAWPGPIVLIGMADLQPVHTGVLGAVAGPVVALVAGDESDAAGFDAFGGLVESYWFDRPLGLDDDAIVVVDRPVDQAHAVLGAVREWSEAGPTSADDITVGLGDDGLSGAVSRALGQAGLPARSAVGRAVSGSRPVLLLRALGEFAGGLRFDKLAALLRHPDAEAWINSKSGQPARPWLTLLDRYATDHLAARPTGGWLGKASQVEAMDAVWQAALSLLPERSDALRPLSAWARPIGELLASVYGGHRLSRHSDTDRPVLVVLDEVGKALEQLAGLSAEASPHCSFSQAVSLLIARLSGKSIPQPGGEPAIELVGFLELLLDDAPRLVIAGMNDQHVPASPRGSALMSEGVRRSLGLPGDGRRLARDAYALHAMLGWRRGVRVVLGRRSQDGDPLLPSRLLMRDGDDAMVRRVLDFVEEKEESHTATPLLLTPGKVDRFLIPRPVLPPEPMTSLRVTGFRDYLACPYRFYLKHVLRLGPLDDQDLEMSPGGFGTLAHDALRALAQDDMAGIDDPAAVRERLGVSLDRAFTKAYGNDPPVAARVQLEQLRYRLDVFADTHAQMMSEGWRITSHERRLEVPIEVDGAVFTVTGQIDRIDQHATEGTRVIDYKTSDNARKPDQAHRKRMEGEQRWVDLQLPLYLALCKGLSLAGAIETGYVNLPKKPSDTGYAPAKWSAEALAEAAGVRDDVIRKIREGVFWPPRDTSDFDGLAAVCADEVEDRQALIRASTSGGVTHGGG